MGNGGLNMSRSSLAPIWMSVNANCSIVSFFSLSRRALSSKPVLDVGPELVAVAHAVLGLEHVRLRFPTGDARSLGLAKVIVLGERRQLLRQQRGKHVVQRTRLDAHQLGVGVVAAHLVVDADHLARRTVEVGELLVFAAGIAEMHQPRCLDTVAVLVGDRADVVERARGARGALQPFARHPAQTQARTTNSDAASSPVRSSCGFARRRATPGERLRARIRLAGGDRTQIRPHALDRGRRRILLMHEQIFVVDRTPGVGGAHRRRLARGHDRRLRGRHRGERDPARRR